MSESEKKYVDIAEIPDDKLERVAGGYIIMVEPNCWEVIDDKTGEVVNCCESWEDAVWAAKANGLSDEEIGWEEVGKLRSGKGI